MTGRDACLIKKQGLEYMYPGRYKMVHDLIGPHSELYIVPLTAGVANFVEGASNSAAPDS